MDKHTHTHMPPHHTISTQTSHIFYTIDLFIVVIVYRALEGIILLGAVQILDTFCNNPKMDMIFWVFPYPYSIQCIYQAVFT